MRGLRLVSSAVLAIGLTATGATVLLPTSNANAAAPPGCVATGTTVTCTYFENGTFVVPNGATQLQVLAVGADGADGKDTGFFEQAYGGRGTALRTTLDVGPGDDVYAGQVLTLVIGQDAQGHEGGYPNGGDGHAKDFHATSGGGGGSTEVHGNPGPDHKLVVAAGGGGAGGSAVVEYTRPGGHGGTNSNGNDGGPASFDGKGGRTWGQGGAGGTINGSDPAVSAGGHGVSAIGGDGGNAAGGAGGGGGGGYPAGGGGGAGVSGYRDEIYFDTGRGGGGASGTSYVASSPHTTIPKEGQARVEITYVATPPTTAITTVPPAWVLDAKVRFGFTSNDPSADYVCSLDGRPVACASRRLTLRSGKTGTHRLSVAARGSEFGILDQTPASRAWTVPRDDRTFRKSKGWARNAHRRAFNDSYLVARRKGARLTERVKNVRRVVLVVAKGRGHGVVVVKLGSKKLKTVRLRAGRTRYGVIVPIATFAKPRSGKVTVTTLSGKPVWIDGIGVR